MGSEASIQHKGEYVATLKVNGISGRQAVDGATLIFNCELVGRATKNGGVSFGGVSGRIHLEPGGDLGPVWLLNSFVLDSNARDAKTSVSVCVAASDVSIRRIDRLRASRHTDDIKFVLWLYLTGFSVSGEGFAECQALAECTVSASDWFGALKAASYEARHIIDVPIEHGRVNGVLEEAATHYRRALDQWRKASYEHVLVECRKVLESIRKNLGLTPTGVAEWNPLQKTEWTLQERIEYSRTATSEIFHLSAHSGTSNDPRAREADFALGMTGTLLRYYADR
jgi:hypothetical protein